MNKKIIISLSIIAAVAAVVVGGTAAVFSDTEESQGNIFTAGTIDIAVDDQNPWNGGGTLNVTDMKPSQHEYTEYTIKNVGTNPANVWKTIKKVKSYDSAWSESKCDALNGTWNGYGENPECSNPDDSPSIEDVITYDMSVWVYNEENELIWWQVIYTDEDGPKIGTVLGDNVLLGMIPSGWSMKVQQSYHMDEGAGNEYQGTAMDFDIELYAEQLTGVVWMENKKFVEGEEPTIVWNDGISGEMTYTVKDATFDWEFEGTAPEESTQYSLIFYYEEWSTPSGNAPAWSRDVYVLGTGGTNSSGELTMSGSEDFDDDILNMKVWLVESSALSSSAQGPAQMESFNGDNYLFEMGMMDYYDSL